MVHVVENESVVRGQRFTEETDVVATASTISYTLMGVCAVEKWSVCGRSSRFVLFLQTRLLVLSQLDKVLSWDSFYWNKNNFLFYLQQTLPQEVEEEA